MTILHYWKIIILTVVSVFIFAACGSASAPNGPATLSSPAPASAQAPTIAAEVEPTATGPAAASSTEGDPVKLETSANAVIPAAGSEEKPEAKDGSGTVNSQPVPSVVNNDETGLKVAPDPEYSKKLKSAGISTRGWETDFSLHTVPYDSILSGGPPRDGIPPLDDPKFTTIEDADTFLGPLEPVVSFELNGDVTAYSLQIMTWHEIVNDVVGGEPVAATFCPLCNSAVVFDRRLDGVVHTFGTSGKLRNSDLIMWDRQTESWWQQLTGEGIVGELAGKQLKFLPAAIVSWEDFKANNPDGKVLSRETGFSHSYGSNPYAGYDRADNPPFLFDGVPDGRLLPKERVVTVTIGEAQAAFPFLVLETEKVVNYNVGGTDLVVLFKPGTRFALDSGLISLGREIGATGVFEATLDGEKLEFKADAERFTDTETGSVWTILGEAVEGPLTGKKLTPVVHTNSFWFAVAAFKPDTNIYQGGG